MRNRRLILGCLTGLAGFCLIATIAATIRNATPSGRATATARAILAMTSSPTATLKPSLTSRPTKTPTFTPTAAPTDTPMPLHLATTIVLPSATQTAPPTAVIPTQASSGPCDCNGPDLNCPDFKTHKKAQACFDYCKSQGFGDIFNLDRDNDGKVCEALP
jgi:hypothetical protein